MAVVRRLWEDVADSATIADHSSQHKDTVLLDGCGTERAKAVVTDGRATRGTKAGADIIYKAWSDMSAKEYKKFKGLTKENLKDNMTNKELILNMLAAADGGSIARNARLELEAKTGKQVVTPLNAKDGIKSIESGEE